jgi:threonine synthase
LDPHGGVANWGMHKLKASNKILSRYANVFTKTASEVKFPDLIRKAIGIEPELPEHYKDIYERKERVFIMEPDLPEIEKKVYELLSI